MTVRTWFTIRSGCWSALLILLPVTSMPLIRDLVGSTVVAAPSGLFLALFTLLWLLPYFAAGGSIACQDMPLLGFLTIAFIASVAALFLPIPPFKEIGLLRTSLTGLITLLIGLGFHFSASTWIRNDDLFKSSLWAVNWGGLLVILWSLAQAAAWFGLGKYPEWMRNFQDLISLGPLYRQRATGFALEPSWLAHQLNMLYLPLWLAFSVSRISAHKFRLAGLTFENLLLAGGAATLVLSFSRVGWLAFLLCLTWLIIQANIRLAGWIRRRWISSRVSGRSAVFLTATLFMAAYILGLGGAAFAVSRVDPRMKGLFNLNSLKDNGFTWYANELQFGERVVYWQAGWDVFNQYPLLGVGLGSAGRYFQDSIPSYGWRLIEVRRLMYRSMELPNTKNLWVRILSETGWVGLAFFCAWLFLLWKSSRFLSAGSEPLLKACGLAGVFVLLGLFLEGFSIDSFGMPYLWIATGLLTSASQLGVRNLVKFPK